MKSACFTTTLVFLSLYVASNPGATDAGIPEGADVATLRKVLTGKDDNARLKAVARLQELGPQAAAAAPELVLLFAEKNEDLRLSAALALGKIGKEAVPALKASFVSTDEDVRYYALSAVGWIGPAAKELTPQVIASLNHKSESVRRKAAYALGSIAAAPDDAVTALAKLLADANADVRQAAGDALARYGVQALPILLKTMDHPEVVARVGAIRTIGGIGPDAKDAVPRLQTALLANDYLGQKNASASVSVAAADALAKIGKAALPALSAGVKSQHADVRRLALAALGKVGGDGVPLLVDALGDANADVRLEAARALAPLRVNDKLVILALAYALKDQDTAVAREAATALYQLGNAAAPATLHLLDALKQGGPEVRHLAVHTLMNVRPNSPEVFKRLSQLAKDQDATVRHHVMQLLTPFGEDAVPLVIAGLKDSDPTVRGYAVFAVRTLQGDLSATLPLLTPMLKSDDRNLRQSVVYALGRVGDPALPHLTGMLKDADLNMRWTALIAVRQQGPAAVKAIPALIERLKNESDDGLRRHYITAALFDLGGDGQTALLVATKDHPDVYTRNVVLSLLNRGGNTKRVVPATTAVPYLIAALKDSLLNNRQLAVDALGSFGPEAKAAVTALTALRDDPTTDASLKAQAASALKRIQGN